MESIRAHNPRDLIVISASDDQKRASRVNTFPQWGAPNGLSLEMYLNRDELMDSEAWAADRKLVTWILTTKSTADQSDTPLLAHCETFRRAAFVLDQSATDSENETSIEGRKKRLKRAVGYGIASVFTPAVHRSKGYAKRLLKELHYLLAPSESLPPFPESLGSHTPKVPSELTGMLQDGAFSVLYSDIGPSFYTGCYVGESEPGWVSQSSITWEFPILPSSLTETDKEAGTNVKWIYLKEDITHIQSRVSEELYTQLESTTSERDKDCVELGFLPEQGLLYTSIVRSQLVDTQPGPKQARRTYGFQTSDGGLVVWSPVVEKGKGKGLGITFTMGKIPYDLIARAAASEQYDWIEIWDDRWLAEQEGMGWPVDGRRIERSSSAFSIALFLLLVLALSSITRASYLLTLDSTV